MNTTVDVIPPLSQLSQLAYLAEIANWFIFIVLVLAAWGKTTTFNQFRGNLTKSFKVPEQLNLAATGLLIGFEWLLAVLILIGHPWAMPAVLTLFSVFLAVIVVILVQDKLISCNCFGQSQRPIGIDDLYRNLIVLAAAGLALIVGPQAPIAAIAGHGLLFGMAIIVFQLWFNLHDIRLLLRVDDKGEN